MKSQTLPRAIVTEGMGKITRRQVIGDCGYGLTSFATMEANCSILVRDAEKAIIQ